MTCKSGGTVDLYIEPVLPVPRVVVFGATPAARTLVRIAHAMGYRADVVDPDADGADFPEATRVIREVSPDAVPQGAYVLVATMDERDLAAIEAVAPLMPAYLGVVASRKRFAELRDALAASGIPRGVLDGIAAPAGLDIGARTPEEIALSVMAQIVERRRRPARAAPEPKEADAPRSAGAPGEAIDPVCGMTVAIAGARHSAEVKGRMYYFCCAGCRTKFLADPARYPSSPDRTHTA
jgi:xanthine dehydrogenase accessory factor